MSNEDLELDISGLTLLSQSDSEFISGYLCTNFAAAFEYGDISQEIFEKLQSRFNSLMAQGMAPIELASFDLIENLLGQHSIYCNDIDLACRMIQRIIARTSSPGQDIVNVFRRFSSRIISDKKFSLLCLSYENLPLWLDEGHAIEDAKLRSPYYLMPKNIKSDPDVVFSALRNHSGNFHLIPKSYRSECSTLERWLMPMISKISSIGLEDAYSDGTIIYSERVREKKKFKSLIEFIPNELICKSKPLLASLSEIGINIEPSLHHENQVNPTPVAVSEKKEIEKDVRLRYSEALDYNLRCGCSYRDSLILALPMWVIGLFDFLFFNAIEYISGFLAILLLIYGVGCLFDGEFRGAVFAAAFWLFFFYTAKCADNSVGSRGLPSRVFASFLFYIATPAVIVFALYINSL